MTARQSDRPRRQPSEASEQPSARPKKREYQFIDDDTKISFLDLVWKHGWTIKEAARRLGIPYENAKLINRSFRAEGRILRVNRVR